MLLPSCYHPVAKQKGQDFPLLRRKVATFITKTQQGTNTEGSQESPTETREGNKEDQFFLADLEAENSTRSRTKL